MKVKWLEQMASDVPEENEWLSTLEQDHLSRFRVPKRRNDWRMGRWTAKHAVAAYLDMPQTRQRLAEIEIRPTQSGVPRVFIADELAPVSISISHRSVWAICAVAAPEAMLGCDLELVEPRSDAFISDYFTPKEQELLARASSIERDTIANLLWSAKESALKALGVGLTVDARTVDVSSFAAPGHEKPSEAVAWHPLCVTPSDGQVFHGWWQQSGMLLRTMVASPAPRQPDEIKLRGLVQVD